MRNVLSDFYLDREKKKKYLDFFWWLRKYLMKRQNDENRLQKVLEAAKAIEELEEDYLSGRQVRLSQNLTERLAMLKLGDKKEWLIFLLAVWHYYQNLDLDENKVLYQELKKFSPFRDYFILSLDYKKENGFDDEILFIEWEIKEWVKQLMVQSNLSANKKDEKLIICVPKNISAIKAMFV